LDLFQNIVFNLFDLLVNIREELTHSLLEGGGNGTRSDLAHGGELLFVSIKLFIE